MWNGTAATLNEKPTSKSAIPASSTPFAVMTLWARKAPISARFVDPVAP